MLILSVDPGALRGAYAVLDASGSLLEVADLPKVADHKTRWVDAPVLLSRLLEIKPVATLRRRIPSSIATTRHSGGAGRFRIMNRIASSSSGLNGPSNTTSCALILPMNERVCSTTFFASSMVIAFPPMPSRLGGLNPLVAHEAPVLSRYGLAIAPSTPCLLLSRGCSG